MATRDEYTAKMKAQLDEWSEETGKPEVRFAEASDATKERLAPHMEKAREARDAVIKKIEQPYASFGGRIPELDPEHRLRVADALRDFTVRDGFAVRNFLQGSQHADLEFRAAEF